jgi:hypothetical protein
MFQKLNRLLIGIGSPAKAGRPLCDAAEAAILKQIQRLSKDDPLIGAKLGKQYALDLVLNSLRDQRGTHLESALCALGSLAGYACQASVRAQSRAQGLGELAHLDRVECANGSSYFFGDRLNELLAGGEYSVWSLAVGAARAGGCEQTLDLEELFRHVAATVGGGDFGEPRLPSEHRAHDLPINYLRAMWPSVFPLVSRFCPKPEHWSVLLGLAIQELVVQYRDLVHPCISLQIVMESTVPMSKVELAPIPPSPTSSTEGSA